MLLSLKGLQPGRSFVPCKIYYPMQQDTMKQEKGLNLVFIIVAVIVGSALWKQFDYHAFRFDKPALAVVYALTFVASIYFLIRGYNKAA